MKAARQRPGSNTPVCRSNAFPDIHLRPFDQLAAVHMAADCWPIMSQWKHIFALYSQRHVGLALPKG